ncbi:glycoside hydrolase family protein [Klebsiella michiganensis]|nr:glycoside hydrolase family protein [Klebsiella michiganensis]
MATYHVLNDYESFPHFTREIAETLLIVDLLQCQRELKRRLQVTLNQAQYDALVSLAFSCGAASPALDTVLTHLNHQRFADALSAWENIRSGTANSGAKSAQDSKPEPIKFR